MFFIDFTRPDGTALRAGKTVTARVNPPRKRPPLLRIDGSTATGPTRNIALLRMT